MALFKRKKKEDAASEEEKEAGDEEAKDEGKGKKDKKAPKDEAPAEGEGEAAEGEEGAPAPKKSKKKIIIIGVLAILVLAGAGAGVYFSGILGGREDHYAGAEIGADGKPLEKPVFYTLPEFLINLNTGGKQTSFLKTTVILELAKPTDVAVIEANLPRMLDSLNTYLRELRASDLAGSAGIQRLREELLLRVNKAVAPTKINDVLFKEIVVQ